MKKIFYFFAATLVLAAVGCSKDDAATNDVQYVSELIVNFEGDTRVSASHSAAGLKFAFKNGDVIKVSKISADIMANQDFVYDETEGKFVTTGNPLKVGDEYIAMYNLKATKYNSGIKVNGFLSDETASNMFDDMPMVSSTFVADASGTIATMHHLLGVVEIPVKSSKATDKLKEILLTTDGTVIRGSLECYISDYTLTIAGHSHRKFVSESGVDLNQSTATSIFIPVFPCTEAETVTIDYKLADDESYQYLNHSKIGGKKLTVERGKITKLKELVLE
mgnify:CR=1 FL=1